MLFSLEATAQLHMKANLQTNHLWRGIEVADGLVITGDVNYSLCNGLFNLGFWGGTNTRGTYKEFNNHISFQYKGFSLALWDTYNFSTGATYNNKEFFNYKAHSTGRFLDAILNYYCGERFPLLISCIIRKSKFPQNPKRSVRFSGKRTKRSVQKRKARNTQKAETKVL